MACQPEIRVQLEDFDLGAELDRLTRGRHDIGAAVTFTGLVRDIAPPGAAGGAAGDSSLTLEHYPGMTERQLAAIAHEACQRWPLDACLVLHRHGRLLPGDRIVLVIAASAHRQAAFDACAFLMDWLKTKAPFWKLEQAGETRRWVAAKAEDDAAAARWTRR